MQSQQQLQIQQIKNLMQQIKMSANPTSAIQTLIAQNPNLRLLLNNNISLQQIAQNIAQQKGIDLNALIQQLQS